MNINDIKSLAEIVSANGLTRLDIEDGKMKIRMEKAVAGVAVTTSAVTVAPQEIPQATPVTLETTADNSVNYSNMKQVKSPIVGVFYSAASPDAEPFISIGDNVKKGDVLCIVEAMKLMTEITAEVDGEVADICVKNGDIVEFGQVLFKLI